MGIQQRRAEALYKFLSNRGLKPRLIHFVGEVVVEVLNPISDELRASIEKFVQSATQPYVKYRRKGPNAYQWAFQYAFNQKEPLELPDGSGGVSTRVALR